MLNIVFVLLTDHAGDTALVQYFFFKGEHKLVVAPHGNSRSSQLYTRTMPSMLIKVKEQAQKNTPKRALQFVSNEVGGILEATSAGAIPRNRQQVKDARRKSKGKDDLTHCSLFDAHEQRR